jgi:hypothetical protein
MATVSLKSAKSLNNSYQMNKGNFFLYLPLYSSQCKTGACVALEKITDKYYVPGCSNNPALSLRHKCFDAADGLIRTILIADSTRKFTNTDLFESSIVAMLGLFSKKVKPTPLMEFRDKLAAAVQTAWGVSEERLSQIKAEMKAEFIEYRDNLAKYKRRLN